VIRDPDITKNNIPELYAVQSSRPPVRNYPFWPECHTFVTILPNVTSLRSDGRRDQALQRKSRGSRASWNVNQIFIAKCPKTSRIGQ
jgi:hypothetical protein